VLRSNHISRSQPVTAAHDSMQLANGSCADPLCVLQDDYSDRQEAASDSEQDSVSEDESAVKPHRRTIKSVQPARSLTSQHSDVASQLGQRDHRLCKSSRPCFVYFLSVQFFQRLTEEDRLMYKLAACHALHCFGVSVICVYVLCCHV